MISPPGGGRLASFAPQPRGYGAPRKVCAYFLNPKSPLTHLTENRGFHDPGFQICVAAAS